MQKGGIWQDLVGPPLPLSSSAKLSVGTGVPQCSQCQLSAGTGVPGAGQCQPGGWHSGAQCPASGAALQCLSPVPVALCASWVGEEEQTSIV